MKKKILIQITFNNGLGNLYCSVIEMINFLENYKLLDYEINLYFASNNYEQPNKYINFCEFYNIFEKDDFKIFTNVINNQYAITNETYQDYKFIKKYDTDKPGRHWWDIFTNDEKFEYIPPIVYSCETYFGYNYKPLILPRFNKKIYEKSEKYLKDFKEDDTFIHIRYTDYEGGDSDIDMNTMQKMKLLIDEFKINKNKKYYFSTNNKMLLNMVSNFENIVLYNFNNLDLFVNDHNYYVYNKDKELNYEILLDRLYDNIAQMVSISKFSNIKYYTKFGWISSFLYYGIVKNENKKINIERF